MAMAERNPFLNALLDRNVVTTTIADSLAPLNLTVTTGTRIADERQQLSSAESFSSAEDDGGNSAETQSIDDDRRSNPFLDATSTPSVDLHAAVAAALTLQQNILAQQQQQPQSSLHQYNIPLSPDPTQNLLLTKALASATLRKPRSQKKPIPEELKDNKYFERRRRNNMAAKRSRDARKSREDQVAVRASVLERENAVLRAQVLTLREEALALHQIMLQRQAAAKLRKSPSSVAKP